MSPWQDTSHWLRDHQLQYNELTPEREPTEGQGHSADTWKRSGGALRVKARGHKDEGDLAMIITEREKRGTGK